MEAKLWRPLYTLIASLPHTRRRPKQQFDDRAIVLVLCWAALHHESRIWACDPANWPRDLDRPLPSDATVSRRARTAGVSQLFARARARDRRGGRPDRRPGRAAAREADRQQAADGRRVQQGPTGEARPCGGQAVRPRLPAARAVSRPARPRAFGSARWTSTTPSTRRPCCPRRWTAAGDVVADNAYDSNALHACAAARNHQLIAPPRRCNAGVRDAKHNGAARLRALDVMDSPLTRHRGPAAFGRALYNRRGAVESCFGELSQVGLNYLPMWVRGPRRVALWAAAKILIYLVRRAVKKGVVR